MMFSLVVLLSSAVLEASAFGISALVASPRQCATQLDMATWSDSKAVMDYQNFLQSGKQEPDVKPDMPSAIIRPADGANLLTEALVQLGTGQDVVLGPDEPLPDNIAGNTEYPIYITLSPWHIEPYIQSLTDQQKERNEDFIFFSGGLEYGNIEDTLKDYGYCRETMTQALVTGMSMRKTDLGTLQIQDVSTMLGLDSVGDEKWAGECTACGKWSGSVSERFGRGEVKCKVDFYRDWRRKMWERSMLDAAFHLVGAVRDEATSVAQVATYYDEEVSDMLWEVSQSLRGWKAMTLMFGFEERLFGAAESSGAETPSQLPNQMYPYIWGNKVFTESAMFLEYLWYAKETKGLLQDIDLPPKTEKSGSSIMRQGNLRADGVI